MVIETLQMVRIGLLKRSKWCSGHYLDGRSVRKIVGQAMDFLTGNGRQRRLLCATVQDVVVANAEPPFVDKYGNYGSR